MRAFRVPGGWPFFKILAPFPCSLERLIRYTETELNYLSWLDILHAEDAQMVCARAKERKFPRDAGERWRQNNSQEFSGFHFVIVEMPPLHTMIADRITKLPVTSYTSAYITFTSSQSAFAVYNRPTTASPLLVTSNEYKVSRSLQIMSLDNHSPVALIHHSTRSYRTLRSLTTPFFPQ